MRHKYSERMYKLSKGNYMFFSKAKNEGMFLIRFKERVKAFNKEQTKLILSIVKAAGGIHTKRTYD